MRNYRDAWPAAAVERAVGLWQAGAAAQRIAAVLHEERLKTGTRSAVLGKLFRLGLCRSGGGTQRIPRRGPRRERRIYRKAKGAPRPPLVSLVEAAALLPPTIMGADAPFGCAVLKLQAGLCKHPHGDPKTADFGFCGRLATHGPYCRLHDRLTHDGYGRRKLPASPFIPRPIAPAPMPAEDAFRLVGP